MKLDILLERAVALEASDVHLKVNRPPMFRAHGRLVPMEGASALLAQDMEQFLTRLLDDHHRSQLRERLQADLAYSSPGNGRFRVNIFHQRGEISIALRVIPPQVRTLRALK